MLWAAPTGDLELRSTGEAPVLHGRFPYGKAALLRDGRERRREVFQARAFAASVDGGGDIHLLVHHDFDRPLASRDAGSLTLRDDADGLHFEAGIAPDLHRASYVADFLAGLGAGLVKGISPGFRVREGGDYVKRDGGGLLRVVRQADLIEISVGTRPAYSEAQVEARNWTPGASLSPRRSQQPWQRWRA